MTQYHENSIFEFTVEGSGLFRANHIIQEVGRDFVIVAKHRNNIHQGKNSDYKRTIIPLSMFVLVLPKGT